MSATNILFNTTWGVWGGGFEGAWGMSGGCLGGGAEIKTNYTEESAGLHHASQYQ